MSAPQGLPPIRQARVDEYPRLRLIEREADQLFTSVGIGPFVDDDAEDHLGQAILVLVADDPPVGFVSAGPVDGALHIWQVSVRPDQGRRGIGRALLTVVCEWAKDRHFDAITLTTYRDVPWNGPFYASHGFCVMSEPTPELAAIRSREQATGEDHFGARVAMRLALR